MKYSHEMKKEDLNGMENTIFKRSNLKNEILMKRGEKNEESINLWNI